MPEPPELVYETVAPAEILQRLDRVRERFRTGLITVNDFNASLKAFQFSDDLGRVWSPGATTSQWYRWDLDQWTTADPPEVLRVPQSPTPPQPV